MYIAKNKENNEKRKRNREMGEWGNSATGNGQTTHEYLGGSVI
jgi:hypothetical protein